MPSQTKTTEVLWKELLETGPTLAHITTIIRHAPELREEAYTFFLGMDPSVDDLVHLIGDVAYAKDAKDLKKFQETLECRILTLELNAKQLIALIRSGGGSERPGAFQRNESWKRFLLMKPSQEHLVEIAHSASPYSIGEKIGVQAAELALKGSLTLDQLWQVRDGIGSYENSVKRLAEQKLLEYPEQLSNERLLIIVREGATLAHRAKAFEALVDKKDLAIEVWATLLGTKEVAEDTAQLILEKNLINAKTWQRVYRYFWTCKDSNVTIQALKQLVENAGIKFLWDDIRNYVPSEASSNEALMGMVEKLILEQIKEIFPSLDMFVLAFTLHHKGIDPKTFIPSLPRTSDVVAAEILLAEK